MGDYISRDVAIIEFIDNDIDHIQAPNGKEAVQILSDIPAANVAPVVHGEWIHDGHHRRCNRCGTYFCNTDREGDTIPNNFCPNCGAKMEAQGKE